ncbi:hypothetical protein [Streptomyces sp. JHA26]|uniref:hypothetical protein n=1 Tax=Streptomyces sp. JHA26 TaxID=1917143 RepID=UPI00209B8832|nr:hypothetical protein [Streptomyces sp. JHA26]
MSRLLRYLLIWLSCTAASVTAVILTIHFVVGSTRPTAPVAQSAPPQELPVSPRPAPSPSPERSSPGPSPTGEKPRPTPSRTREEPPEPSPAPTTPTARATSPRPSAGGGERGCEEGGAGVYTVPSRGGRATVRFGDGGVCLVSAVPEQGFTVSTSQSAAETLTVTFSASRHRSEITATTEPRSQASVREVSF